MNNNQKLPGTMETHVIDGRIPLLLSQHAQAAMSLVKLMGESKCMVGLGRPEVELCRVKESGLLCINLSSALTRLKDKKLPPSLKELKLSSSAPTAFPAMMEPGNTNPVLISCGKEFDRSIVDFVEANAYNKVRAGRTVAASFGLSTRTTWIVNVLKFGDPHHDPTLPGHAGCHPEILKGFFATTESQAALVEMLRILVEKMDTVGMVVYCNKNRHRSVGVSWLLASAYGTITGDEINVTHANAAVSWSQMSGSCKGERLECRHESAEVREAANVCVQAQVGSYLNEKPDDATLARVRREIFEVKPVPTNKVTQRPGSYGAPVLKRAKAEDKQTSKAASPSTKSPPTKTPPTRTVSTRPAPGDGAEFKQPPPKPPPPPQREDKKPIAIRSRTPVRRERPGSAGDRLLGSIQRTYASSRASSASAEHREEESTQTSELLATMKAMQKQLDELKKEKEEASRRRRRRSRSHSHGRRRRSRTRSDSRDSRRRGQRRPRTPSPPRAELRGRPPLPRPPSVKSNPDMADTPDTQETAGLPTGSSRCCDRAPRHGIGGFKLARHLWSCWTSCTSPRTRDGTSRPGV